MIEHLGFSASAPASPVHTAASFGLGVSGPSATDSGFSQAFTTGLEGTAAASEAKNASATLAQFGAPSVPLRTLAFGSKQIAPPERNSNGVPRALTTSPLVAETFVGRVDDVAHATKEPSAAQVSKQDKAPTARLVVPEQALVPDNRTIIAADAPHLAAANYPAGPAHATQRSPVGGVSKEGEAPPARLAVPQQAHIPYDRANTAADTLHLAANHVVDPAHATQQSPVSEVSKEGEAPPARLALPEQASIRYDQASTAANTLHIAAEPVPEPPSPGTSQPEHRATSRLGTKSQERKIRSDVAVVAASTPTPTSVPTPQAAKTSLAELGSFAAPLAVAGPIAPSTAKPQASATVQRPFSSTGRAASTAPAQNPPVPTANPRESNAAVPDNAAHPAGVAAAPSTTPTPTTSTQATLPTFALDPHGIGLQGGLSVISGQAPAQLPAQPGHAPASDLGSSNTATLSGLSPSRNSYDLPGASIATPNVLEVGVAHNTEGWLRIRAEVQPGSKEIVASVLANSAAAVESLHRQVPAINAYLASEQLNVASVVVERVGTGTAFAQAGNGSAATGDQAHGGAARHSEQPLGTSAMPADLRDAEDESAGDDLPARYAGASGGWLNVRA